MVCLACGNPVEGEFCSRCGMRVPPIHAPRPSAPHPVRFEPRVPRHVRTVGILWCVWGAYRAVLAVLATIYLVDHSSRWAFSPWGPIRVIPFFEYNPWLRSAAPFIAILHDRRSGRLARHRPFAASTQALGPCPRHGPRHPRPGPHSHRHRARRLYPLGPRPRAVCRGIRGPQQKIGSRY